jgi:hypothetical protein
MKASPKAYEPGAAEKRPSAVWSCMANATVLESDAYDSDASDESDAYVTLRAGGTVGVDSVL